MADRAETLTVTDNRTGRSYELPIVEGAIRASELRTIKKNDDDPGLLSYDPGYTATASCRSAITYIDGERGILRYRGYPIEELAEHSSFLEVAYLLIAGELPNDQELGLWVDEVKHHTLVHENIRKFVDGFHHDAHPMGILVSTVAALSTFYPDAKLIDDPGQRRLQIVRLMAKSATLAAFAFRHAMGFPYVYPDNDLSYAGNFLSMMFKMAELKHEPDPALEHALDVLFMLHADHEQNCSTSAMRQVGSSRPDPYSAAAAAIAALYGPLHGGANEQVLRMLTDIGKPENVASYVAAAKDGKRRLMGFGHRMYRSYDPRGKVVRRVADEVFNVTGISPLLEVALELERVALKDDYFVERHLYPNVDYYTGMIYQAMGFPVEMYPVLFAIGRMPGWLAQWEENLLDAEQKLNRPRQLWIGHSIRHYIPMPHRAPAGGSRLALEAASAAPPRPGR
jgi:citrate synthase